MIEREIGDLEGLPLGIGHIAIGCALGYLDYRFDDLHWREGRPRAAAWYAQFAERPSMRLTAPHEDA
jgi:glutathione S-transferase